MKLELGVNRKLHDPDAETVSRSLAELDWKREIFAKLSRDKLNYIQAAGSNAEGFIVEYQDGSEDRFFRANDNVNIETVKNTFVAYSRGETSFQSSLQWQNVDPNCSGGRLRPILAIIGAVAIIVFLLVFAIMQLMEKFSHPLR